MIASDPGRSTILRRQAGFVNRSLIPVAVLACCFLTGSTTHANGALVRDPPGDAKGSPGLDIASIRDGHRARLLAHRLTTYGPWKGALLANRGQISFYFDTDNDSALERRLDVGYTRGRLSAVMKDSRGRFVGTGRVERPNRHAVVVRFARSLLRPGIRSYRWFAFSGLRCRHRYKACGDTAPNGGSLITTRLGSLLRPPTEPAPIAGLGYHRAFADDFDAFNRRVWSRSIWYDDPAAPGDIYARNGVLHLVSRRASRYPNVSVTTLHRRHFRGGYFEARMRWTKGNGSWPAFWLFSVARASGNVPSPEIDVFEGQGSEPNVFYGTVHRNSSNCCGMPDQQNGNNSQRERTDLAAGFHTYSALWSSTSVTWYLDGRKLMSAPVYDTTENDMFLILNMWTGGWTNETDANTPAELHTEVDWVRVWKK
jgi:hypothetical protein